MDDITNARVNNDENVKPDQSLRQRRIGDLDLTKPKTDHSDLKSATSVTGIDAYVETREQSRKQLADIERLKHLAKADNARLATSKALEEHLASQRRAAEDSVEFLDLYSGHSQDLINSINPLTQCNFGSMEPRPSHNNAATQRFSSHFDTMPVASRMSTADDYKPIFNPINNISDLDLNSPSESTIKKSADEPIKKPTDKPINKSTDKPTPNPQTPSHILTKEQRHRTNLATRAGAARARKTHIENLHALVTGLAITLLTVTGIVTTFVLSGDTFGSVLGCLFGICVMVMMVLVNGVKGWLID